MYLGAVSFRLVQLSREHRLAICLAILTSIIVAFPQVYFRIDHKDLYQEGVTAIELLPDSPRSAHVREVQDGHQVSGVFTTRMARMTHIFINHCNL